MRRVAAAVVLIAAFACSSKTPSPTPAPATPKPTPTLEPATAGGTVPMGRTVVTSTGSKLTVAQWHRGAKRDTPAREAYQTVLVRYCASTSTTQNAADLVPLFSLEMPGGNIIAPDSVSEPNEFRTKGTIGPGQCKGGAIVFQVGSQTPRFVVYQSDQETKWTVP